MTPETAAPGTAWARHLVVTAGGVALGSSVLALGIWLVQPDVPGGGVLGWVLVVLATLALVGAVTSAWDGRPGRPQR